MTGRHLRCRHGRDVIRGGLRSPGTGGRPRVEVDAWTAAHEVRGKAAGARWHRRRCGSGGTGRGPGPAATAVTLSAAGCALLEPAGVPASKSMPGPLPTSRPLRTRRPPRTRTKSRHRRRLPQSPGPHWRHCPPTDAPTAPEWAHSANRARSAAARRWRPRRPHRRPHLWPRPARTAHGTPPPAH